MQNARVTIGRNDLMNIVDRFADNARLAIFLLNDFGFEEATKSALDDEDFELVAAIQMINDRRTDAGEDAVKLIDMIDDGQF